MKLGIEKYEQLERYLLDQMSSVSKTEYKNRLTREPELAQEAEIFKELIIQIQHIGVRNQIHSLHRSLEKKRVQELWIHRGFLFLLGGILLVGLIWIGCIYFQGQPNLKIYPQTPSSTLELSSIPPPSLQSNPEENQLFDTFLTDGKQPGENERKDDRKLAPTDLPRDPEIQFLADERLPIVAESFISPLDSIPHANEPPPTTAQNKSVFQDSLPDTKDEYDPKFLLAQSQIVALEQLIGKGIKALQQKYPVKAIEYLQVAMNLQPTKELSNRLLQARVLLDSFMLKLPSSSFRMGRRWGDDIHKPVHAVELNEFYIDKKEVTVIQFCRFLNVVGSKDAQGNHLIQENISQRYLTKMGDSYVPIRGMDNSVMRGVTWYGANAYALHHGKRLPTEAEWEFVAHQFQGNSKNAILNELTSKQLLTEFLIDDRIGEWCSDWFSSDYYRASPIENPQGPVKGVYKIIRGGKNGGKSVPTNRAYDEPEKGFPDVGFRCVYDLQ